MKLKKLEAIVDASELDQICKVTYRECPEVRKIHVCYGYIDMATKPFGHLMVKYGSRHEDFILLHHDQIKGITKASHSSCTTFRQQFIQ
jgi:hypothetical protein